MNTQRKTVTWLKVGLVGAALAAGIVACGGGGGGGGNPAGGGTAAGGGGTAGGGDPYGGNGTGAGGTTPPAVGTTYMATNLVSDGTITAAHTDANLVNAWGIAFNPTGFVWVADHGTNKSTLYDGNGVPQSLVVSIPAGTGGSAGPTGIVYNGTQDFKVTQNGVTGASPFIFVGQGGTVSGWSPTVNGTAAITVSDGGANGPLYKGLAISSYAGANYLYAADFRNNAIDVYNGSFTKVTLPGSFHDPALPTGYAPFGIQSIGNLVYVAYAKQATSGPGDIPGAGLGIIDVFDSSGAFIKQLAMGGVLNAPWGMTMAPANFGPFSGDLLVANFGDGKINAFNPSTGKMDGTLSRSDGTPIVIDGLWGLAFGNGVNSQPNNTLFFTAGPSGGTHGLYGRIDLQ
ncbi:MAG: hypothetical protein JWP34_143 [Massilia sp.]|nr:hypothetical protein [Massilia sp.]